MRYLKTNLCLSEKIVIVSLLALMVFCLLKSLG